MATDDEDPKQGTKQGALIPMTRHDLSQAGNLELGRTGRPSWSERGRLWAHKKLAKAQDEALEAKQRLHDTAQSFLRSQTELQTEIERNRKWFENIDSVRANIQAEFDAEDRAREYRRLEQEAALSEARVKADEAAAKVEETRERLAREKERRAKERDVKPKPKRTAEDIFREEAEQVLRFGTAGKYVAMAEEMRQEVIAERGGEDQLTDEDRERIEVLFELARRRQESKS